MEETKIFFREVTGLGIEDNGYDIWYLEPNEENGYNIGCLFAIPPKMQEEKELIVRTTTVICDGEDKKHQLKEAREQFRDLIEEYNGTNAPVCMPILPEQIAECDYKNLSEFCFNVIDTNKQYSNIDKQALNVIKTAMLEISKKTNKDINSKVFLAGGTEGAKFALRFAFLHPEFVSAVQFNDNVDKIPLPVDLYKKEVVKYPFGTADYEAITGNEFSKETLESYKEIDFLNFQTSDKTDDAVIRKMKRLDFKVFTETFGGTKPVDPRFFYVNRHIYDKANKIQQVREFFKGLFIKDNMEEGTPLLLGNGNEEQIENDLTMQNKISNSWNLTEQEKDEYELQLKATNNKFNRQTKSAAKDRLAKAIAADEIAVGVTK